MITPKPTTIHHHPNPSTTLIPLLESHLPQSAPLLRRIQHELIYPSKTAFILSTIPPTPPTTRDTPNATSPEPNTTNKTPWLASHIDLFRGRETQITLYSSLEQTSKLRPLPSQTVAKINFPTQIAELTAAEREQDLARDQLLALLRYVNAHLLPEYLASYPNGVYGFHEPGKVPAAAPTAFLVGSIHTGVLGLLTESGVNGLEGVPVPWAGIGIHRVDVPLGKYVFGSRRVVEGKMDGDGDGVVVNGNGNGHGTNINTVSSDTHFDEGNTLPERYSFRNIPSEPEVFGLVRSRTRIFRSDETLEKMNGVGIYYDGDTERDEKGRDQMPIAWAFISNDGSLATLHVERDHRGKGFAGKLVKETVRRAMSGVYSSVVRDGYWHADVEKGNIASKRVMEKIGGRMEWTVAWVVVEVV